jgi:hypothetical protein
MAREALVSVSGNLVQSNVANTSNPIPGANPLAYNESGSLGEAKTVLTQSVVANTGFYFYTEPSISVSIGVISNYAISNVKTYNTEGLLIQVDFTISYTFPANSAVDDILILQATALSIYVTPIEIQSYTFPIPSLGISSSGASIPYTIYGGIGAAWVLNVVNSLGTVILNSSGVISSQGIANNTIVFPSSSVEEVYTVTLTGDLASSFDTVSGQPSVVTVNQYVGTSLGFGFEFTRQAPVSNDMTYTVVEDCGNACVSLQLSASEAIGFIGVSSPALKPFTPMQVYSNVETYTVTGSSATDITLANPLPSPADWTNQGGGYAPIDLTYNMYVDSFSLTVDNTVSPKTITAVVQVVIDQAGTPDLNSYLNLNTFTV